MVTHINEPIKVGVIFEKRGSIRPAWFVWNSTRYEIREVTYTWSHREGTCLIQNFAVTDGANLYQISYHKDDLIWRLMALENGG